MFVTRRTGKERRPLSLRHSRSAASCALQGSFRVGIREPAFVRGIRRECDGQPAFDACRGQGDAPQPCGPDRFFGPRTHSNGNHESWHSLPRIRGLLPCPAVNHEFYETPPRFDDCSFVWVNGARNPNPCPSSSCWKMSGGEQWLRVRRRCRRHRPEQIAILAERFAPRGIHNPASRQALPPDMDERRNPYAIAPQYASGTFEVASPRAAH
jgi:hypothetical protein